MVGIVAIPLGMAFAIASGVGPEYGLYTVIVAGILISLLGGSKYQIGGPTGAFVPILFAIVMQYGFENLLVAGFMAGVMPDPRGDGKGHSQWNRYNSDHNSRD